MLDLKVYDDFNDNSLNASKWGKMGTFGMDTNEVCSTLRQTGPSTDPNSDWYARTSIGSLLRYPPPVSVDLVNISVCATGYYVVAGIGDPDYMTGFSLGPRYNPTILKPDPVIHIYGTDGTGTIIDKDLGLYPPGRHNFRFDCDPGQVSIYFDGNLLDTEAMTIVNCSMGFETDLKSMGDTITTEWDNALASFRDEGIYTSKPLDTGSKGGVIINKMQWASAQPTGTNVSLQFRTSANGDMSSASSWKAVLNGEGPGLVENAHYIQYRAILSMGNGHTSPVLTNFVMRYLVPIEKVEISADEGVSWKIANGTEQWSVRISLPENATRLWVMATDMAGATNVSKITVNVDTTPPSGEVFINGGAEYTDSRDVMIWINATDRYGISEMRISEDPGWAYSIWEPFTAMTAFRLSKSDGLKTVYVKLHDSSQWESDTLSASIILDTSVPTGSILINNGDNFTNSANVSISIGATDTGGDPLELTVSNTEDFNGAEWMPYVPSLCWTLMPGDGTRTVFAKLRDIAGLESVILKNSIILDPIPPQVEINVNSGSPYSNNALVTLTINVTENCRTADIGISQYPDPTGMEWQAYKKSVSYSLTPGDGTKVIYVRARDMANNTGPVASCSIMLDTLPPDSSISQLPAETNGSNITVTWNGSDATSGILSFDLQYRDASGIWVNWIRKSIQTSAIFSGTTGHTYYFRVRALDRAGNQQEYPGEAQSKIFFRPIDLPIIMIDAPSESSTVHGVVTILGRAYHPDSRANILRVEIRIDSGTWRDATGISNWSFQLNTRNISNGHHIIFVRAYDGERFSLEIQRNITVQNLNETQNIPYIPIIIGISVAIVACASITIALSKRKKMGKTGNDQSKL